MRAHVEKSKRYELDKNLIKEIYKKKEKKQRIYKLSKKNVVYDKQLTDQYLKYSNNNRNNYYSSYQSFRDYISSGYNYDFLVNEINNIKSILGFSRNIRDIINKRMEPEKPNKPFFLNKINQNQNQIIELNEESNSSEINTGQRDPISILNNNSKARRTSTVFGIDKENPYTRRIAGYNSLYSGFKKGSEKNNFIEICKLLKLKEEEFKGLQNQYQFRLFSSLMEDFDPFFLPVYENFMNVKYENQKTKLIRVYNQENAFIECVTLIKSKLKANLMKNKDKDKNNNINNNNLNNNNNINNREGSINQSLKKNNDFASRNFQPYMFQMKIPYINGLYLGRTEIYFKNIDNFMSMYKENTSLAAKSQEKDFFGNMYNILTFNSTNCKKFLQYLYSNSYFFKYIYNIFTVQNKLAGMTIKNFAPSIKKHTEDEHFLNDSMKQLFNTDDSRKATDEGTFNIKDKNENEQKGEPGEDLFINSLLGNEFIYKINIYEENVSEYINNKKVADLKKILTNSSDFNENYLITLNGTEKVLKILNTKKYEKQKAKKKANLKSSKILLSVFFDDKIVFYDLEKEMKENMKIKEKKKNEKFVLIGVIQSADNYSYAYIFKLSKDIYKRFENSISSNGSSIKKSGLFDGNQSSDEDNTDNQLKIDDLINEANDMDKDKKQSSNKNKIIGFEDSENDSEKNNSKKKSDQGSINQGILKPRGDKKQLTFGANMFSNLKKDNLNESDEKDNDEDKSDKNISSADINSSDTDEKKSGENEDDEKEDSEEKEGSESDEEEEDDEDTNKEDTDNNEENDDSDNNLEKSDDDNKPEEKNKDTNEKKEEKNSNDNKDISYSDKSRNNEEDSEEFLRNNDKKEEEINTDIRNTKIDKKDNLESKILSEKEDAKSDSSG